MKGSFVIGKIKGIEIEINISWFVIFGLVIFMLAKSYFPQNYPDWSPVLRWVSGSIIALLLFASVLLHELSHSLVSIGLGIEVKKITLFIFGGLAQIEGEPDDPIKELKIAIAGPAMSIFLFVLFLVLAGIAALLGAPDYVAVLLNYLADINLILAIFNMVPAFPLDGGRVFRALVWHFKGNLQYATKIASAMGNTFGYFLIFIGIFWMLTGDFLDGIWFAFIGWFISQASQSSYQNTLISDIFNKIHVSEFMTDKVVAVDYFISVQELVDHYFYKYKYFCFPVKRNEEITGIVSIDNINSVPKESWNQTTVGRITVPLNDSLIVSSGETVSAAMNKLFANRIGRVLVMDGDKLIGIVSRTDILNYIRIHSQLNH